MIRVFLDTEFTGLGQRRPCLISIGLISEDGQHSFYAELPAEDYLEKVTPWVQENVLPLLKGGACVLQPNELRQRLAEWIASLGTVQIVADAPDLDFAFFRAVLDPLPGNVAPAAIRFDTTSLGYAYREELTAFRTAYYTAAKPEHHALHDARALRQTWLRAKPLDAFHDFLRQERLS